VISLVTRSIAVSTKVRNDNGSHCVTHQWTDPWPTWPMTHVTHDPWPMTYDSQYYYCLLSAHLLHQHKIKILTRCFSYNKIRLRFVAAIGLISRPKRLTRVNVAKLITLKSHIRYWNCSWNLIDLIIGNGSIGNKYWPMTHVTHADLLTHLTHDPLTHDPLTHWQLCKG